MDVARAGTSVENIRHHDVRVAIAVDVRGTHSDRSESAVTDHARNELLAKGASHVRAFHHL